MSKPKLLHQLHAVIRVRHYSVRTEHAYVDRVCRYIVFHGKRHPGVMGAAEISKFLSEKRNKPVIPHESVKSKKITIVSAKKMPLAHAMEILEAASTEGVGDDESGQDEESRVLSALFG